MAFWDNFRSFDDMVGDADSSKNSKSYIARLGQFGQQYTDPLYWIFGHKYGDMLSGFADKTNAALSKVAKQDPIVQADRRNNPLQKTEQGQHAGDWAESKPADSIAAVLGAIYGGGALAGGLGSGGSAGAAGGVGGVGGVGGGAGIGSAAGSGIPAGMEGVTVVGSSGGGLGAAGAGVGAGAGFWEGVNNSAGDTSATNQRIDSELSGMQAPSVNGSGFDWQKFLKNQAGGGGQQQEQQPQGAKPMTWTQKLRAGLARIGDNMLQIDSEAAKSYSPEQLTALKRNALLNAGLGMVAASNRGAGFGEAASFGLGQAQNNLTGALQRGYENARQTREEQRQAQRDQATDERFKTEMDYRLAQAQQDQQNLDTQMKYKQAQDELAQSRWETEQKATADWRKLQIDAENKRTDAMGAKSSASVDAMTPEGMEYAAEQFYRTGVMPSLGNGSASLKAQIISKAAEKAAAEGNTPVQSVLNAQANKAGAAAMTQLSKQQTLVSAFEKNASKNADVALAMSEQVDRAGVPLLDKYINSGRKAGGDVELAKFQAANDTFVNEYAKVMSGSMGNTPVSDSAREHAHDMLNTAQSKEQYRAVVALLKQEMSNRMAGFAEEQMQLRTTMGGSGLQPSGQDADPLGIRK